MTTGLRREQLRGLGPPEWVDYDVGLTNVTLGTGGTTAGRYRKQGRHVEFSTAFTLGTTGALTGALAVSLPFTVAVPATVLCVAIDATAGDFGGFALLDASGTTLAPFDMQGGGAWTVAVPFTWAVSDRFVASGFYETTA